MRILHVSNFGDKHNARLYWNQCFKISNGFIRNGHNVYNFSDRDRSRSTIFNKFNDNEFAVTDISHSKAIIEIEGKEAKEILKKGCPFNFGELEKNQCLNSTYNGMSVTIDMLNDDPDKFRIFGLRSFGESLYHSISDASLEFGYIAK